MSKKPYPSEAADRFIVRLPDGMRDRIKAAAEANNRSMNAEVVARIEDSFRDETAPYAEILTLYRDLEARKNDPFNPAGHHSAQARIFLEMLETARQYDADQEAGKSVPLTRLPTDAEWYLMRPALAAKHAEVLAALRALDADTAVKLAIAFNESKGYVDGKQ